MTRWRLLNSLVIITFGMWKAISAYLGYSTLPTTIDWILGVMWALISYWASLLESEHPTIGKWLMQDDLKEASMESSISAVSILMTISLNSDLDIRSEPN
ncbi:hypothetical protein BDZ94DRAFT_1308108 [Collybia nuda]|uniref:Uncharacterized protein n=1 Tax=Collybia nuda TaxID=64659 RepID=A0A9P5Y684_9AGAR|nr:hypothetical protein BDZ94DRAFT_1308108 [Collybia nuda]